MKALTFAQARRASLATAVAFLTAGLGLAQSSSSSSSPSSSSSNSSYNDNTSSSNYGSSSSDRNSSNSSNMSGSSSDQGMSMTGRDSSMSSSSNKLGWMDRHFVNKVADANQDEIQLAELALQRSSNPDVKQYAQRLVQDHQQMGSDLQTLASEKNVKLDTDNDHDRTYKRLSKANGTDFDREFVSHMVDDHEKDIKDFEKRASDAKDSDVKQFAQSHLATLRQHLQMAQNLNRTVMPTGREDQSSGRSGYNSSSSSDMNSSSSSSDNTGSSSTSPSSSGTSSGSSSSYDSTPSSSGSSSGSTTKPEDTSK